MRLKFSLAAKLISICVALAAIPLLVIGCLNLWQFHSFAQTTLDRSSISLKKQSEDILDSGVMVDRERISGLISRAESDAHHLARSSWLKGYLASISGQNRTLTPTTPKELAGDDPSNGQQASGMALEGLKEEIAAMHQACAVQVEGQTFPAYSQIRYIDEKGQEIVNLKDGKFTTDLKSKAAETWFQKTLQLSRGSVYNSGVVIAANTGTPEMRLAAPVFLEGSAKGVIVLNMNWDLAWRLIQNRVYGKTGYSYIVNEQGILVSHPKYNLTQPMNLCDPKNGELAKIVKEQMITGQGGRGSYTFEGIHKVIAFLPLKVGDKFYSIAANTPLNEFLALTNDIKADADKSASRALSILAACTLLMVLLSGMAGFFCSRTITRPLQRLVEELTDATDHVAAASAEVSTSSQNLAEGASEQAAAIEETSSSLEEMSSMTKQNSDNASQANHLMRNVSDRVEKANNTMNDLTSSMHEIASASEETQKIIKTIDEIAFQTNLLALNAAVEAARAGEAGAGFAVVADEVRNLALRAAEAAKNTAKLIEGTVKKIQEGVTLVTTTNGAFADVRSSSASVGELVGEIAVASSEQAQGISQINNAVAEMDKVVQRNAAGAEEAASASEEMSSQAMRMQSFVNDLQEIITGGKQQTGLFGGGKPHAAGIPKASGSDAPAPFHPAHRSNGDNGKRSPDSHGGRALPPSRRTFALEERDLDDF